jgi:hypothetical protein
MGLVMAMAGSDQSAVERERKRRLRGRNWAIFAALAAFVAIVYVVTIVKMQGG